MLIIKLIANLSSKLGSLNIEFNGLLSISILLQFIHVASKGVSLYTICSRSKVSPMNCLYPFGSSENKTIVETFLFIWEILCTWRYLLNFSTHRSIEKNYPCIQIF